MTYTTWQQKIWFGYVDCKAYKTWELQDYNRDKKVWIVPYIHVRSASEFQSLNYRQLSSQHLYSWDWPRKMSVQQRLKLHLVIHTCDLSYQGWPPSELLQAWLGRNPSPKSPTNLICISSCGERILMHRTQFRKSLHRQFFVYQSFSIARLKRVNEWALKLKPKCSRMC